MGPIQVVVQDGNNVILEVTPTPSTTVILDRGIAGPPGPTGTGDVDGPASSTDNAVARFDGTTGKLIQNSVVTISDAGAVAGVTALTASGSVTLSGGTANGVAYLNGSKVLTTGSALQFNGFSAGTLTVGSANGSKIVFPRFSDNAYVLEIASLNSVNELMMRNGSGGGQNYLKVGNGYLAFGAESSEQMRLTSTGLGIGTSSPSEKLHISAAAPTAYVQGTGSSDSAVRTKTTLADFKFGAGVGSATNCWNVYDLAAGAERMRIDSAGNTLIGTTTALSRLNVAFSDDGNGISVINTNTASTLSKRALVNFYGTDTVGVVKNSARTEVIPSDPNYVSTALAFYTRNSDAITERMRLDSTGNLLIGTTTNTNASRLVVNGTISETIGSTQYQVVSQADIGSAPNEIPLNQYLGNLAYQDASSIAGQVGVQAGTAAAPAITPVGDTNTGMFFPAADTIAFAEGGVEAMRIDSAGNVGIGTSSPEQRLDLGNGNIRFGANLFSGAGVSTGDVAFEVGGGRTGSGNVYIDLHAVNGTDFESRLLRLGGTNGAFQLTNTGTGDLQIRQEGAGPIIFYTSSTERARITSGGDFGIGTSSPATKLHVFGAGAASRLENSGATTSTQFTVKNTVGTVTLGLDSSTGGGFGVANAAVLWYDAAYPLVFGTSNTERARIDSSGSFLIGLTSASSGGFASGTRLAVNAGANLAAGFRRAESSGTNEYIRFTDGDDADCGSIDVNATANTTAYNTSSDYRLKQDVAPMVGALAKVSSLKPCTWNWKHAPEVQGQGFVAHELAEVVPDCVTGEKDAVDAEGKPQYQGIDTSFLVATLTAAIQELKAEFDAYKASHP
jgi:hypothetical protein